MYELLLARHKELKEKSALNIYHISLGVNHVDIVKLDQKNKLAICKVIAQVTSLFVSLRYSDTKDAGLLGSLVALLYCSLPSILNYCYELSPDVSDSLIRHYTVSFFSSLCLQFNQISCNWIICNYPQVHLHK